VVLFQELGFWFRWFPRGDDSGGSDCERAEVVDSWFPQGATDAAESCATAAAECTNSQPPLRHHAWRDSPAGAALSMCHCAVAKLFMHVVAEAAVDQPCLFEHGCRVLHGLRCVLYLLTTLHGASLHPHPCGHPLLKLAEAVGDTACLQPGGYALFFARAGRQPVAPSPPQVDQPVVTRAA